MKCTAILLLLGLSLACLSGQTLSGVATYQSARSVKIKFDNSSMAPDMQEMIQKQIAAAGQKKYLLSFTPQESLFEVAETLQKEGGFGGMVFMGSSGAGAIYHNGATKELWLSREFFGKKFLIEDTADLPQWQLHKESKQIGQYRCYKASYDKIDRKLKITRKDGERHDSVFVDTIEVVAWYTPQIPVSHGPGEAFGLPGLILELHSGGTTFVCSQVTLNPAEPVQINKPEQGEVVSRAEFKKITQEKLEQMREMNRGQGRRGGNGSVEISIGN